MLVSPAEIDDRSPLSEFVHFVRWPCLLQGTHCITRFISEINKCSRTLISPFFPQLLPLRQTAHFLCRWESARRRGRGGRRESGRSGRGNPGIDGEKSSVFASSSPPSVRPFGRAALVGEGKRAANDVTRKSRQRLNHLETKKLWEYLCPLLVGRYPP